MTEHLLQIYIYMFLYSNISSYNPLNSIQIYYCSLGCVTDEKYFIEYLKGNRDSWVAGLAKKVSNFGIYTPMEKKKKKNHY